MTQYTAKIFDSSHRAVEQFNQDRLEDNTAFAKLRSLRIEYPNDTVVRYVCPEDRLSLTGCNFRHIIFQRDGHFSGEFINFMLSRWRWVG